VRPLSATKEGSAFCYLIFVLLICCYYFLWAVWIMGELRKRKIKF